MRIYTQYNVGQAVWFNWPRNTDVTCNICEGQKTIEYKDQTFQCPNCYGRGVLARNLVEVPHNGRIKQYVTDCEGTDCVISCGSTDYFTDESNCFLTEAAAQATADRLNMEAGK